VQRADGEGMKVKKRLLEMLELRMYVYMYKASKRLSISLKRHLADKGGER
jgi:hypothetical protein